MVYFTLYSNSKFCISPITFTLAHVANTFLAIFNEKFCSIPSSCGVEFFNTNTVMFVKITY